MKILSFAVLCCLLLSQSVVAGSVDLLHVYRDAKRHDPQYQQAIAIWLAAKEKIPQGQANLLPTLITTASTAGMNRNIKNAPKVRGNNKDFKVTLTQPLFDYAAWQALKAAKAEVKQAAAIFQLAQQQLVQRVASAYFVALQAEDLLSYQKAQQKATARQLEQANQKFDVGLVTKTSVYQARAGHDKVVASVIEAANNVRIAHEALRQITGVYYPSLQPLQAELKYPMPFPDKVEAWVAAAKQHNLNVVSARYAVQAGKAYIQQAKAGHLPTLSAVGEYEEQSKFLGAIHINTDTRTAGLKFAMPLFQGGAVRSLVRQSQQQYQQTHEALRLNFRQAEFDARKNFHNLVAQISKIKADRQAIVSGQSSMKNTENAYRLGTQTIIDVLNTQRDLYEAQANYAEDQYGFINSWLALKLAAGALAVDDLAVINRWLVQDKIATA